MRVHTFPRSLPQLAYAHSTVTSALPCLPEPGDSVFVDERVQRSSDNVSFLDNTVLPQHSDQLIDGLSLRTSTASTLSVPLLSVTQTTVPDYVNVGPIMSLPSMPAYVNMSTNGDAPLSRPTGPRQLNVTDATALYAHSYTFDATCSSISVALDRDIAYARSSYADNSQPLPIAVGQPGLSAFSRVDVTQSRPVTVDPTTIRCLCVGTVSYC